MDRINEAAEKYIEGYNREWGGAGVADVDAFKEGAAFGLALERENHVRVSAQVLSAIVEVTSERDKLKKKLAIAIEALEFMNDNSVCRGALDEIEQIEQPTTEG